MTAQASATGRPLPAPLGDALPSPRRPDDDAAPLDGVPPFDGGSPFDGVLPDALPAAVTAAIAAPVPLRSLLAGPAADADGTLPGRTESARVALARARLRGVPMPDAVEFVSACPGCGRDARWHEEREDTRLRVTVTCDC